MIASVAVLAAGGSTRLGSPKQLLPYRGRSLLRAAAEAACGSRADEVLVVLGAEAGRMEAELSGLRARTVQNDLWRGGLSTSIRAAVRSLSPACEAVLLMACDQPAVTTAHLDLLLATAAIDVPVASGYGGTKGIPALFPRALFPELLRLTGDAGAKIVLTAAGDSVITVPLPGGETDIDTPSDAGRAV